MSTSWSDKWIQAIQHSNIWSFNNSKNEMETAERGGEGVVPSRRCWSGILGFTFSREHYQWIFGVPDAYTNT